MRYHVIACDYDGTLAHDCRVSDSTLAALEAVKKSGRKLILVTGRRLDELQGDFKREDLFERLVVENGALIYNPATKEERVLATAPPPEFRQALRERKVEHHAGRVIVASWTPYEMPMLEVIHELGLEWHLIFNKGAVMALPSGVNKAFGLKAALAELCLSPHNAIAVGDAENDQAMFELVECSVAVANALPIVKRGADHVTKGDHGHGVEEMIAEVIENDLAAYDRELYRRRIVFGRGMDERELSISAYGPSIMVSGASGGGKSHLAIGFLERLQEQGYQYCVIDPEGDYQDFADAVVLGGAKNEPVIEEALKILEKPDQNLVVNMIGVPFDNRPMFFDTLFRSLLNLRTRTGRPHWIVIDEVHHLTPETWAPSLQSLPQEFTSLMIVSAFPEHVSAEVLKKIGMIAVIGDDPGATLGAFAKAVGQEPPRTPRIKLKPGEALIWRRDPAEGVLWVKTKSPSKPRWRHRRKYAEGEIPPERSFFFRGPENKLKLRAQNLITFLSLADGVDDGTWLHHLKKGDYSRWFREVIKDKELSLEAQRIEQNQNPDPEVTRTKIREAVESRYTAPA